jgi:hypothetical protein
MFHILYNLHFISSKYIESAHIVLNISEITTLTIYIDYILNILPFVYVWEL